jgi:hypothetical protein
MVSPAAVKPIDTDIYIVLSNRVSFNICCEHMKLKFKVCANSGSLPDAASLGSELLLTSPPNIPCMVVH